MSHSADIYDGNRVQAHAVSPDWKRSFAAALMLARREWVRFFRQPFRVIAALGQPILFWILFGTGLHGAFRGNAADENFMTYFLPGTADLILLFTAIFSTISIIEDRREGFLQGVLVSPTSSWAIVLGKGLGGAAIAWAQAVIFLALAYAFGALPNEVSVLALGAFLALGSLGITCLGVCFAWPMDSTQSYHAAMNLVLLPMWLLSGAFFPIPSLAASQPVGQWLLHWTMRCNPMTYIVAGIRHCMHGSSDIATQNGTWVPSNWTCWTIAMLFAVLVSGVATWLVQRRQRGELQ
jgi:ABC-2 type transport system permease protein